MILHEGRGLNSPKKVTGGWYFQYIDKGVGTTNNLDPSLHIIVFYLEWVGARMKTLLDVILYLK